MMPDRGGEATPNSLFDGSEPCIRRPRTSKGRGCRSPSAVSVTGENIRYTDRGGPNVTDHAIHRRWHWCFTATPGGYALGS
jgi:hypothetical protein